MRYYPHFGCISQRALVHLMGGCSVTTYKWPGAVSAACTESYINTVSDVGAVSDVNAVSNIFTVSAVNIVCFKCCKYFSCC